MEQKLWGKKSLFITLGYLITLRVLLESERFYTVESTTKIAELSKQRKAERGDKMAPNFINNRPLWSWQFQVVNYLPQLLLLNDAPNTALESLHTSTRV